MDINIDTKFNIREPLYYIDKRIKFEWKKCIVCDGEGTVIIKNMTFNCPHCHKYLITDGFNHFLHRGGIRVSDTYPTWNVYYAYSGADSISIKYDEDFKFSILYHIPEYIECIESEYHEEDYLEDRCFSDRDSAEKECFIRNRSSDELPF